MIVPLTLAALLLGSGGSISGGVRLEGPPPGPAALPVTQDVSACGANVPDESLIVDAQGELADAVVFLSDPPAATRTAAARTVELDQKGCRFTPHVIAAEVGSKLVARNSDPVLHTVHAVTGPQHHFVFDVAMPFQGAHQIVPLTRAGLFALSCSANHPWMHAWLRVFDHPFFAVTDAHGHFALPKVPPGDYDLVVWQERLGEKRIHVKVGEAGAKPVTIELEREGK